MKNIRLELKLLNLLNILVKMYFQLEAEQTSKPNSTPIRLCVCCTLRVVPENIHAPPAEGFYGLNPQPLWKFQFRLILSFNNLGL